MNVNSIPFICEYQIIPEGWFSFSDRVTVAESVCCLPLNLETFTTIISDPQYKPNKYVSYMVVNHIANHSSNGVRYS